MTNTASKPRAAIVGATATAGSAPTSPGVLPDLQTHWQLTAGQAGDNPMLWPLLKEHRSAARERFRLLY